MQRMWFRHNSGNFRAVFGAKPWKSKHTLQQKLRKFDKNFKIMSAEPSRHPNKTCSQTLPKKIQSNQIDTCTLHCFWQELPSLKRTEHLPGSPPKRKIVFQPSIFMCYASFREGILKKYVLISIDMAPFETIDGAPFEWNWKKTSPSPKISLGGHNWNIYVQQDISIYIYRHMYDCFMIEKKNILQMMFIDTTHM